LENESHKNSFTPSSDVSHEGPRESSASSSSLLRNLGAFAMRHKRSLSAVCLLVLLAVVFRPLPGSGESLAQETAKAISKAKSVRFELTQTVVVNLADKPLEVNNEGRGFWMSNGARRMEFSQDGKLDQVSIMFRDRMGVDINHRTKSFCALGPRAGQMSPLMKIQQLGSFKGKADQEPGRSFNVERPASRQPKGRLERQHSHREGQSQSAAVVANRRRLSGAVRRPEVQIG
jgi:hypothetical protein